ncbi:hypothetical protein GCM10010219_14410 [Streptomyces netropsis]|nr:hypothetical protein GCM10010219_14410 [Streptomyces netropsis]
MGAAVRVQGGQPEPGGGQRRRLHSPPFRQRRREPVEVRLQRRLRGDLAAGRRRTGRQIVLDGVGKSKVGTAKWDDGTLQVMVGGWPAYRFTRLTSIRVEV